jgi:hypothetical protein
MARNCTASSTATATTYSRVLAIGDRFVRPETKQCCWISDQGFLVRDRGWSTVAISGRVIPGVLDRLVVFYHSN